MTDLIEKILKDGKYHLGLFSDDEIADLSQKILTKDARGKKRRLFAVSFGKKIFS